MIFATILLAAAAQDPGMTESPQSNSYLPVCVSGKWGYINSFGEMMIACRFDMARRFHNGRAAVRHGSRWYYIQDDGTLAFPTPFREARDFQEGFAAVMGAEQDGRKWHFINTNGEAIAGDQRWSEVGDFSNGLAALVMGRGVGYLNREGEVELTFGMSGRLPSDFHYRVSAYSYPLIGGTLRSTTQSRAFDNSGETIFEKEGILTRIPTGFIWQKDSNADAYQILDDDGNPVHDDWVESVVMPVGLGPVAVERNGKWEYVGQVKEGLAQLKLQSAFAFSQGMAVAEDSATRRVGFIDDNGSWVIPPQFTFAGDFDRNFALVKDGDSVGWVDKNGKLLWTEQEYPVQGWEKEVAADRCGEIVGATKDIFGDELQPLELGEVVGVYRSRLQALAAARVRYGAEVILDAGPDSDTHFVYAVDLSMFFDRIARVDADFVLAEDDLRAALHYAQSGDMEKTMTEVNTSRIADDLLLMRLIWRDAPAMDGKLQVVAPGYFECREFVEPVKVEWHTIGGKNEQPEVESELLPAPQRNENGEIYYWSPQTFEAAFDGTFEDARPFSEGLASARKDGLYGFLNLQGEWVIAPAYSNTSNFSEGIAMVVDAQSGKLGGIDSSGKTIIPFQSHALGDVHQGRARIVRDEKWGFVDLSGKEIIPAQYEWVGDFASGLAPFKQNGLCGYLNLAGEVIVKPTYRTATTHVEGMATAVADEEMHYLNAAGEIAFRGEFQFASDFYDGVALIQQASGRWRLIDSSGELHAPVEEIH